MNNIIKKRWQDLEMQEIQKVLDELSESIIKSYRFDILNNTIYLSLLVIENSKEKTYDITIFNVSMHYFVNNTWDKRKNISRINNDEYLECTSISLLSEEIQVLLKCCGEDKWLCQYNASGNLVLEIWNRILIVEAQSIKINEKEFKLY